MFNLKFSEIQDYFFILLNNKYISYNRFEAEQYLIDTIELCKLNKIKLNKELCINEKTIEKWVNRYIYKCQEESDNLIDYYKSVKKEINQKFLET